MTCYFHYRFIDRTIQSLRASKGKFTFDLYFLENPSIYTPQIRKIAEKYNIKNHYICNDNIGGQINVVFLKNLDPEDLSDYDFIAITEGDVVLDKYAIAEAIYILNKHPNLNLCSINIRCGLPKYKKIKHKIANWVSHGIAFADFVQGGTGFQFILFKKDFLFKFIHSILDSQLKSPVARGVDDFTGLSDTNLGLFCRQERQLWARTKHTKLDHIGWEPMIYINDPLNVAYTKKKNELVGKKIRVNLNYDDYKLKLLTRS